jgi:Transmembrane secretion effector
VFTGLAVNYPLKSAWKISSPSFFALMPVVGFKVLHLSSSNLGLLFTSMGAGSVIGAVFIIPWLRARFSPDSVTLSANLMLVVHSQENCSQPDLEHKYEQQTSKKWSTDRSADFHCACLQLNRDTEFRLARRDKTGRCCLKKRPGQGLTEEEINEKIVRASTLLDDQYVQDFPAKQMHSSSHCRCGITGILKEKRNATKRESTANRVQTFCEHIPGVEDDVECELAVPVPSLKPRFERFLDLFKEEMFLFVCEVVRRDLRPPLFR